MKSCLLTFSAISLLLSLQCDGQPLPSVITIQAPVVIMRAEQDEKSAVVMRLKQMGEVTLREKGDSVMIDGVKDFWYKVSFEDKTGYVPGNLTSLRRAGRRTIVKKFTKCEMSDRYHFIFEDMDFGLANNFTSPYEFCREDPTSGLLRFNSRYVGKSFELTLSYLFTRVSCSDESTETCIKLVETIVGVQLLDR